MKFFRSRAPVYIILVVIASVLAGVIYALHKYYDPREIYKPVNMFLDGEYSVDDGEWKPINPDEPIRTTFHKIVFKGHLTEEFFEYPNLEILSKNVWFRLSMIEADNKEYNILRSLPRTREEIREVRLLDGFDEDEYMQKYVNKYYNRLRRKMPNALKLPDTPGYQSDRILVWEPFYDEDTFRSVECVFEVENPYENYTAPFNECVSLIISNGDGNYINFFFHVMPFVLLFALVCFFGIFFFPAVSFLLGKVNYKNLAFGILLFLWGLYMIMKNFSIYLNMWITDPTVCVLVDMLVRYAFYASILIYFRAFIINPKSRATAGLFCIVYIMFVIIVAAFHILGKADIVETSFNVQLLSTANVLFTALLLLAEIKENKNGAVVLVSWIPMAVAVLIDMVNWIIPFTTKSYFVYGLTATMIYQLIRLIIDLKLQFKEAIRYQQAQKELYEAKVGVMVSQIQPHFMYNALTSIAMMCTEDPETAQEATVTFAKYLRGNMDSLKTTAPVPFSQELEHLKKYLYIEKLRFDDMLNIVYDIQTEDFVLPQLSVQPLVENAVKHGVGMKEDGGTVTIATRETEDDYRVIISDDGVGFDVNAPKKEDGRSHVGMENTTRRLKDMVDGEVVIESTPGEGTVATLILPKSGQPEKEDTP